MKAEDKNMEYQILEAAEELFLEQGFTKTTTGQIAKLAGCNQALVHYYYRTKEKLFEKIFEEKIRLMATNFLKVDSSDLTFQEKIAKLVKGHFDFLMQNPRLAPFIINEVMSNSDRLNTTINKLAQYPKSIFEQLESDLKNEIEKGCIRPVSGVDLLLTVISLNVVPFVIKPIFQKVWNMSEMQYQDFLNHRINETTETILSRLRV